MKAMSAVAATTHHRKDEARGFGGHRRLSRGRTATNRTKGSTAFATGLQILARGRRSFIVRRFSVLEVGDQFKLPWAGLDTTLQQSPIQQVAIRKCAVRRTGADATFARLCSATIRMRMQRQSG